jgi:hypothetical protein
MNEDSRGALERALKREDPMALLESAASSDVERLKAAEELFEKRHQRKARSSRLALASQALVGYVALAGFFANAYQNLANSKAGEERARLDEERWSKEFKRAQDADKYRAFFETSALATDSNNADKRLVGYALLKEFVHDKDYNSKATLMLEESLAQELRSDTSPRGLDEGHRAAIIAILVALSDSSDCKALEQAARSVDKLAKHHARTDDVEETGEVFRLYVRRLVGRAAVVCGNMKEFHAVRRPIRDTLIKAPELGGLKGKMKPAEANRVIAELLWQHCAEEVEATGVTDCPDIAKGYERICEGSKKDPKEYADDVAACQVMHLASTSATAAAAAPATVVPVSH